MVAALVAAREVVGATVGSLRAVLGAWCHGWIFARCFGCLVPRLDLWVLFWVPGATVGSLGAVWVGGVLVAAREVLGAMVAFVAGRFNFNRKS